MKTVFVGGYRPTSGVCQLSPSCQPIRHLAGGTTQDACDVPRELGVPALVGPKRLQAGHTTRLDSDAQVVCIATLTFRPARATVETSRKSDLMQRPNSSTVLVTVAFLVLPVYRGVGIGQESPGPATPAVSTAKPSESAVQLPEGVDDILKLSRGKVHEDVTLAFVEGSGRRFNLTASQILELHKEGVSDRVLAAMLRGSSIPAPEGPQAPLPPAPATSSAPSSVASVSAAQPAASSATEEPTYVATASAPNSFASSYPYTYAYPYYSYGYPY